VALKNVDFTKALSKAIEQTVEAEQQAKRADIVQAEAEQKIAQARGVAEATLTQARDRPDRRDARGRPRDEDG